MKASVLGVVLLLASICPSKARMGETPDECEARYGKHTKQQKDGKFTQRTYKLNGFVIQVIFGTKKGAGKKVAHGISYMKPTEFMNARLSKAEIETFLKANAQGKSWGEVDLMRQAFTKRGLAGREATRTSFYYDIWQHPDDMTAWYEKPKDVLTISTGVLSRYMKREKDKKLSGF
ncbi:hypothetical protein HN911_13220 [Candidatus Bathyarchaeota archaeon]|nr:hypothetical protein [Candidatus Bathyarchaeota archaeon]